MNKIDFTQKQTSLSSEQLEWLKLVKEGPDKVYHTNMFLVENALMTYRKQRLVNNINQWLFSCLEKQVYVWWRKINPGFK